MSDFRRSSLVTLIRWLLIKNGFAEDQADAIIDKLRFELTGVAAKEEDNEEIQLALTQRLARYATQLQLGGGASPEAFENRYEHNCSIISQIIIGGAFLGLGILIEHISENTDTVSHPEIYYEIGNVYLREGAYDRAIDEYNRAIELNPIYSEAFNSRGTAYGLKGQDDRAISDFDQAIKINPRFFRAFDNLGIAHSKKGEYDLAIEDFTQAIKLNPNYAGPFSGRGHAYAHKGEYDLAIEDFDQAIKLKPDYAEAFYNRGFAHYQVHRYHRAILDYDQAIKLRPDFAEAFYNLGYAHYQAQLYHHAIEDFDRFIKLRPDFANAFEIRSFVKRAIGDLKGAEDDATRAKQLWRRR